MFHKTPHRKHSTRLRLAMALLAASLLIAGVATWRLWSMEHRVRGLLGKIDPKTASRADVPPKLAQQFLELGADSLPVLFRIMSDPSPPVPLHVRLRAFAVKAGLPFVRPEPPDRLREKASWAIQLHGKNALPLLSDFRLLLSGTNVPLGISKPAIESVASWGTNGLPLLVALLGSQDRSIRNMARYRLQLSGFEGWQWTLDVIASYERQHGEWDDTEQSMHLHLVGALGGKPVESLRLFQKEFLDAHPDVAATAAAIAGVIFVKSRFPENLSNAGSWTGDELAFVRETRPLFAHQLKERCLKEPDPARRDGLMSSLLSIDHAEWLELQKTVIPSQKSPP